MSVESAFERVLGRAPSEDERARLYRLRDALGVRDNDALWSIVIALEHYDAWFRQYPKKLGEETSRSLEEARMTFAAAAQNEAAHVERMLAEKVAETSVEIARTLAERPIGLHRVTMVLGAVVAFGALSMSAGYHLAGDRPPFWVSRGSGLSGAQTILASLLRVPAGWMVFALLVPAFLHGVRVGWGMARADPRDEKEGKERMVGWSLIVLSAVGAVGLFVVLAKIT